MDKCKLGMISQERSKIQVKLLLNANRTVSQKKFPPVNSL